MPDVFLSYSREDQAIARQFAAGLEREGLSVWWDQSLNAGEAFDRVTEQALADAKAVVVLWSKQSVNSDWVRAEATQARADRRLVPVMIEPCKRPIMFELTHTADLSGWAGEQADPRWRAFVDGLRRTVGRTEPAASKDLPATGVTTPSLPVEPRGTSRQIAWAAAAAALVIGLALFWFLRGHDDPAAAPREISIAVLPFTDMSPNQDQGYFADGVAEEILNSLARIADPDLKVISRNSSFVFRKASNLKEVGATLGVEHVLEGSVRQDGNQLRITAQLINTETDAHLWSQTYDRPMQDIFDLQLEIARKVAEALQVRLGVGFGRDPGMTGNVDAYALYLESQPLWVLFTPDSRRRVIGLLEQAVDRDPSFATAWQSLSNAYASMPTFVAGDVEPWQQKSDAAFAQFQRLMPDSPAIHNRMARASAAAGQWKQASAHAADARAAAERQGIRVSPGMPFQALRRLGRLHEAMAQLEQQKARDPLNPDLAFWLAHSHSESGDARAAFAEVERGAQVGGTWPYLMSSVGLVAALGADDREQMVKWMTKISEIAPDPSLRDNMAWNLARLDKPDELLAQYREQAGRPSATPLQLSRWAPWLAYLGDSEGALKALRGALANGGETISLWSSVYRDVRKLEGFKDLVREQGLVDAWREAGWGDFCKPIEGSDDFACQ